MSASTVANPQGLYAPKDLLGRIGQRSLYFGIAGAAAMLVGLLVSREEFFRAYLLAYMYWLGLSLGCLALVMLQYVTGGHWGMALRRIGDAAAGNIFPLMAVLFLPVGLGMRYLYPWANPAAKAADPSLEHSAWWLSTSGFWMRSVVYLAAWTALAQVTKRWSRSQDEVEPTASVQRRYQAVGGAGIVIYAFTLTFASVDWVMSLDPHWKSTIYGFIFIVGEMLLAMSFSVALLVLLVKHEPMKRFMRADFFQDLGKLMLAFIMLWAYFQFSQWLIIWSGNLPDEIGWYLDRIGEGWQWVAGLLIVFHFAVPFAMLLSREIKRDPRKILRVAVLLVVMRYVDLYWYIIPNFQAPNQPGLPRGFHFSLLYIAAPVAIGGFWLWLFFGRLAERPILPVHDPMVEEMSE